MALLCSNPWTAAALAIFLASQIESCNDPYFDVKFIGAMSVYFSSGPGVGRTRVRGSPPVPAPVPVPPRFKPTAAGEKVAVDPRKLFFRAKVGPDRAKVDVVEKFSPAERAAADLKEPLAIDQHGNIIQGHTRLWLDANAGMPGTTVEVQVIESPAVTGPGTPILGLPIAPPH